MSDSARTCEVHPVQAVQRGSIRRLIAGVVALAVMIGLVTLPGQSSASAAGAAQAARQATPPVEGSGAASTPSPRSRLDLLSKDRASSPKRVGLPVVPTRLSQVRNGKLYLGLLTHPHRSLERKRKADRHASSRPDVLKIEVLVAKPGVQATVGGLVASEVMWRKTFTRTISREGLLIHKVNLPQRIMKAIKRKPAALRRVVVNLQHQKDIVPSTAEYDALLGTRLTGAELARNTRKAGPVVGGRILQRSFIPFAKPVKVSDLSKQRASATYTAADSWNSSNADFDIAAKTYQIAVKNGCGGTSSACDDLSNSQEDAVDPKGIVIMNNTPFMMGLTYSPLSCVAGNSTPALPSDEPTPLAPNAVYIDYNFAPIDSKYSAADAENVTTMLADASKAAIDAGWKALWATNAQKGSWLYSPDPKNPKAVNRSTANMVILMATSGIKFISTLLKHWLSNTCENKKISDLWTVSATPLAVDENAYANGNPRLWNYNGTRTQTVSNPGSGAADVVTQNVPVGVGGVPVPEAWGKPQRSYVDSHIGLTSQATWRWAGGNPDNAPNPNTDDPSSDQNGGAAFQGGIVQTVYPGSATLYLSFLGSDSAEFGPNPVGTVGERIPGMRTAAEDGGTTNPGGTDITCYPGQWNLTTPWSAAGPGTFSNMDLRSVVVDSSPNITAAAGVGYQVSFHAYDDNWNELYSPDFLPGKSNTPGLGINALPVFVPVVKDDPVSGSVSKAQLQKMVYLDGTPYGGIPTKFGCTFTGITSIPQGQSFNTAVSGGGGRNANQQWQSVPYVTTASRFGDPVLVVTPKILNAPTGDSATSAVEILGSTGEWKNVSSLTYGWVDCRQDSSCLQTGSRRMGTNKLTLDPKAAPGDFATGDYFTFEVTAVSPEGISKTFRTPVERINGPAAAVETPALQFDEGHAYTSLRTNQGAGENEYIFTYWTTDYACGTSVNPDTCTWTSKGVHQVSYPPGAGNVQLTDYATAKLSTNANTPQENYGRYTALRVTVEARHRGSDGAVTSVTHTSPVYLGYNASVPGSPVEPRF